MYNLPLAPYSPVYGPESASGQVGDGSWAAVRGARAIEIKRHRTVVLILAVLGVRLVMVHRE